MKALQLFSQEALDRGQQMTTEEILRFLEEFRLMYAGSVAIDDSRTGEHAPAEDVAQP